MEVPCASIKVSIRWRRFFAMLSSVSVLSRREANMWCVRSDMTTAEVPRQKDMPHFRSSDLAPGT
jgi:hypothetical protein